MRYVDMRKIYSIMSNTNLLHPKIIKEEDFVFPKQSLLIWLDFTIKYHPYGHKGLLFTSSVPNVFLSEKLITPIGKTKRNSVNVNTLHSLYKKEDKKVKFISIAKSIMTSPSKLLINNVSLVNELYKYSSSNTLTYEKTINKLLVGIDTANDLHIGLGRQRYMTIELPDHFPTYNELESWKKLTPKSLTNSIEDPRTFILLELYKFVDDKLTSKSYFNKLERLDLIDFIFTYKEKFIVINGQDLRAILKDKKHISKLSGYSGSKARKVFMVTLLKLMVEEPVATSMLKNKVVPPKDGKIGVTDIDDTAIDDMIHILEADKPDKTEYVEEDEIIDIVAPDMEELINKPVSIADNTVNNLTLAYNKGELTKAQFDKQIKRIEDQREFLTTLDFDKKETILDGSEKIPQSDLVPDATLLSDKTRAIRRTYLKQSHEKNIQRAIYGVQGSGHTITNVERIEEKDILEATTTYKVTIGTADKVPTTLTIKIPTLDEDGIFTNNGNEYLMRGQRTDAPIKKKSATEVLLNSFYGKLTISRDKYSKNNISQSYLKQIKANEKISNLILKNTFANIEDLPIGYTIISKVIKSFKINSDKLNFSYTLRDKLLNKGDKLITVEKQGLLIGKRGKKYIVLKNDQVTLLGDTVVLLGTLDEYLDIDQSKVPPQVATVQVYTTTIPVGLMLLHKYTFSQLLKITKVQYTKVPFKNGIRIEPNEYKIVFSDFVYIFDKTDRVNTLLFAGLAGIKELKGMPVKNVDNLHGLINVGSLISIDKSIITEVKNIFNLFLDPMTINTLTLMEEPTVMEGLLFRAMELLLTDYSPLATDLLYQEIMGDKRIAGLVYKQIAMGIRNYENKKSTSRAKITVNPYETLQIIVSDSSTVLVDDLNPIALLKQTEDVTYTGFGGRNKDTLTRESRKVHPNDIGTISEAVKDSTEVGVSAYMSADPLLDGTTGLIISNDDELTKANIFSPTTLLFPYNDLDD